MTLTRFNPFTKERQQLVAADLAILRDVSEGWYVDYKRDMLDVPRIAKHVSSFANTYGGWLFFGILGGGPSNTAVDFPGIPSADVPKALEKISQACSSYVSPAPYFETTVIHGPDTSIGLPAGRSVILVETPLGGESPYVHGSGKIYRRVGDQSEPKPETDRALLDMLWTRQDKARKRLRKLFKSVPDVSKAERDNSYLHLFVLSDPIGDRNINSTMGFKKFAEIMRTAASQEGSTPFGLPFDTLYSTATGFGARQTRNNNPVFSTLTLNYRQNGDFIVHIPLPWTLMGASNTQRQQWHRYKNTRPFLEILERERYDRPRVVDLSSVFFVLGGLFFWRRALLTADNLPLEGKMKVRLEGLWRRIPYLDTDFFIEHVNQYGLPCVRESDVDIPSDTPFDLLDVIDDIPPGSSLDQRPWAMDVVNASLITMHVASAFGIPGPVNDNDITSRYMLEMFSLFDRFDQKNAK